VHVRKERESLLQKKPPKGKNGDCDGENSWISGVSPGEEEEEENVWGGREEVARETGCANEVNGGVDAKNAHAKAVYFSSNYQGRTWQPRDRAARPWPFVVMTCLALLRRVRAFSRSLSGFKIIFLSGEREKFLLKGLRKHPGSVLG